MPTGVYERTDECRKINSESHKGIHPLAEFKKGNIPWNKGRTDLPTHSVSKETRRKISIANIGKKHSLESKEKMRLANLGSKKPEWVKNKQKLSALRGERCNLWRGGLMQDNEYQLAMVNIHSANRRARKRKALGYFTLAEWNRAKEEFNFTCPSCRRKEPEIKLTKDHIIPLSVGGTNFISNIQPLCFSCNCRKQKKIINFKKGEGNE